MSNEQEILDNAPEGATHVDGSLLYTDKKGVCSSQSGYSVDVSSVRSLADIKANIEKDKRIAELEKSITTSTNVMISLQEDNLKLEKDVAFYRCCSLSGEIPDDLCKPSSIALQAKALKESK
jgi:hypothetical protein